MHCPTKRVQLTGTGEEGIEVRYRCTNCPVTPPLAAFIRAKTISTRASLAARSDIITVESLLKLTELQIQFPLD